MIVVMDEITITILLALLGLCIGSYAGASVWRLRARQLLEDKKEGELVDSKEYSKLEKLTKKTKSVDRSRCLHCSHTLAWYDLIPLVSWLGLRGKCRYCKKNIGRFEPVVELGTAAFFAGSYLLWPVSLDSTTAIVHFSLWLIAASMLVILFVYDLKWFLLPDVVVFPLILVGLIEVGLKISEAPNHMAQFLSVLGAVAILSGLYYGLWLVSRGRWVGFGDVKLGLGLALFVGDWRLAFVALFAANFIGCIVVIPGMLAGKISRMTRVPFGPLLIAGAVIVILSGPTILNWYMRTLAY